MKLEESPEEIRIAATGRRRWEHEENMRAREHPVRSQEERTSEFF